MQLKQKFETRSNNIVIIKYIIYNNSIRLLLTRTRVYQLAMLENSRYCILFFFNYFKFLCEIRFPKKEPGYLPFVALLLLLVNCSIFRNIHNTMTQYYFRIYTPVEYDYRPRRAQCQSSLSHNTTSYTISMYVLYIAENEPRFRYIDFRDTDLDIHKPLWRPIRHFLISGRSQQIEA